MDHESGGGGSGEDPDGNTAGGPDSAAGKSYFGKSYFEQRREELVGEIAVVSLSARACVASIFLPGVSLQFAERRERSARRQWGGLDF